MIYLTSLSYYPSWSTHNLLFIFGSYLLSSLVVQVMTGVFLSFYYSANYLLAFKTISYLMIDVNYGYLLRFLHMTGASFFMLFLYLHFLRAICYNSYYRSTYLWYCVLLLFIFCILESFLGYLLPFGQMSYWAAIVIMNILSVLPFLGSMLTKWIWCSRLVFLHRIFSAHFIMAGFIVLFVGFHIGILHSICSINPIFCSIFLHSCSSNVSYYFINFWPILAIKDFWLTSVVVAVFSNLLLLDSSFFGDCNNSISANPIITPIHIVPEWYFLIFYSILRTFPNKTMGVLILSLYYLSFITLKNSKSFTSFSFLFHSNIIHSHDILRFDDSSITMIHFYRAYLTVGFLSALFLSILLFIFGAEPIIEFFLSIQRLLLFSLLT